MATRIMYQGIFDTEFDKYRRRRGPLQRHGRQYGVREPRGFSEGLEDQSGRIRQVCARAKVPSFLEYGEYPFFSAMKSKSP